FCGLTHACVPTDASFTTLLGLVGPCDCAPGGPTARPPAKTISSTGIMPSQRPYRDADSRHGAECSHPASMFIDPVPRVPFRADRAFTQENWSGLSAAQPTGVALAMPTAAMRIPSRDRGSAFALITSQ